MIAISRFRVPEERTEDFVVHARAAIDALSQADGFLTGDLGRNLDEPTLWTVSTRWRNVGSYRRGLGTYQARMAAVPLLSLAIDEPSAYEDPVNFDL
ncbi:antibiotic biosynthesis monooxygenase [Microlunatus elymi]|uniref:Antibiotic biosynthesis monooxygenase n=1 Tax=Microlunatus elymi TaxID=2596828 RepID=A0A516PYF1_9ACTN|nr:antibiotic biosynthesis monooxygenase family protein [Microlunatus elymi]QDP96193.1 antibiotic biosynthesis monooxygenase [Microlunatus elymi]